MVAVCLIVAGQFAVRLGADDRRPTENHAAASALPADKPVWLSDLPEHDVHVGQGQFGKNGRAGFVNATIAVNGVASPHWVGTYPPNATVSYDLDKRYRSFHATVTINDSSPGGAHVPILFRVLVDGKQVWESRGIKDPRTWQPVLLDIPESLSLMVYRRY